METVHVALVAAVLLVSRDWYYISNFPSLRHCLTADIECTAVQDIVSNCTKVMFYFRYHFPSFCELTHTYTLDQLYRH